jgi:hypothetical protein
MVAFLFLFSYFLLFNLGWNLLGTRIKSSGEEEIVTLSCTTRWHVAIHSRKRKTKWYVLIRAGNPAGRVGSGSGSDLNWTGRVGSGRVGSGSDSGSGLNWTGRVGLILWKKSDRIRSGQFIYYVFSEL